MGDIFEISSFAPGGFTLGSGLLGAMGQTPKEVEQNRLLEIERRILAIEERLNRFDPPK